MLFAPFGTQLVLHTHTALESLLGWVILPATTLVAAHNLVLLLGLAANGLATYALAFYFVRRVMPSLVAGVLIACSAFVQVHLLGHFNLTQAWVIPLFVLAFAWFLTRPSKVRAVCVAAAAAAVTYSDYYYTVYCWMFAALWLIVAAWRFHTVRSSRTFPALATACLVLLAVDAAMIGTILVWGGGSFELGGVRVSMRGVRNLLTVFWILLACWTICRHPIRLSLRKRVQPTPLPSAKTWIVGFAVYCLLIAPLLYWSCQLFMAGDYVTQRVLWRSSPPGIDAVTVLLGHPRHMFTGGWTQSLYSSLGIDVVEQSGWFGLIPLVLFFVSPSVWLRTAGVRVWLVAAIVFFLIALGPFLRVGGFDTGLPLPHAVLRYLPVLSNARIPGRAFVMVQLSVAMLTAFALAQKTYRMRLKGALVIAVLVETLPSPVPLYSLPSLDAVDSELLSATGTGAVAELPTGLRDGFGEVGRFDHRALVHQTMHQRPLVGGFVARLSGRVREEYLATPLLATLLSISEPAAVPVSLPSDASLQASELGIEYIVINRDTLFASERLSRAAMEGAGFRFVRAAGARELYTVRPGVSRTHGKNMMKLPSLPP